MLNDRYLILPYPIPQANPKDTDQIFSAIDWRVQQMKMRERSDEPTTPVAGDDAPIPGIINEDSSSCPPPQKRQQEEAVEDTVGPKKKARLVEKEGQGTVPI